ncbi:MAG: hypothetical protein JXR44_07955 [Thiotrichales bacterium]|nr:hypothetical protein [Thiotrichales bacterium]
MQLMTKMRQFMQLRQLSLQEISETTAISLTDLEDFLTGKDSLNAHHWDELNQHWPEMIAYCFDIDPIFCKDNQTL